MQKPASFWQAIWSNDAVRVITCPRCRHLSRFQQAQSDGAWVCQCCLRYRLSPAELLRASARKDREPARA